MYKSNWSLLMPRLSIIIPAIGRRTLKRALDSYLPTMASDDEIVVVADGRQDISRDIVWAIDDKRVIYCETPPTHNWGAYQADTGIRIAHGDAIMLCGDDDYGMPKTLDLAHKAIGEAPLTVHIFRYTTQEGYWSSYANIGMSQQMIAPIWAARYIKHADSAGEMGDIEFVNKVIAVAGDVKFHHEPIIFYCQNRGKIDDAS
jgi:glycosyltransferase involved in cell wall biosynthesis